MTPQMLGANPIKAKAGDKVRFTIEPIKIPKKGIKLKVIIGVNIRYPITVWIDGHLFVNNPPESSNNIYRLDTRMTAILQKEIMIEGVALNDGLCTVMIRGESDIAYA